MMDKNAVGVGMTTKNPRGFFATGKVRKTFNEHYLGSFSIILVIYPNPPNIYYFIYIFNIYLLII